MEEVKLWVSELCEEQRGDGNHASDNQSADVTGLRCGLHMSDHEVLEASGGVKGSILFNI